MEKVKVNMYFKKYLLISILALSMIALFSQNTNAAILNSNWATKIPTIDGTISAGEWDDAFANIITAYAGSTPLTISFYAKNDADNLYLRVQWLDISPSHTLRDALMLLFDEGNDGNWSGPGIENGFCIILNGSMYFGYDGYCIMASNPVAYDTVSQDGLNASTYYVNGYIVELAIPLGCGEQEDLQNNAGDTIGIAIVVSDYSSPGPDGTKNYDYPNGTFNLGNQQTISFQLASAPSVIGTPRVFLFFLASIIFVAIISIWKKISKDNSLSRSLIFPHDHQ
ncbi:MAG: hypothetical protein ACTSYB_03575 [Candidatus Helarchaeota archaeon]